MKRGRKRGFNPRIPAHIDQTKIPDRVYWNNSGKGSWLISYKENGIRHRKRIAGGEATLADLYRVVEEFEGVERDTFIWLSEKFHESPQFRALSKSTRSDYEYCRRVLQAFPTRIGKPFADVPLARLNPPTIQKLVDKLAITRGPSTANHVLRYMRRVFRWGINRGHCQVNPSGGVEGAKERKQQRLPELAVFNALRNFSVDHGAPYLWMVMDLAYTCRLRGIEVATLTDADALEAGILCRRRKGSRTNVVRWGQRNKAAWDAAVARRAAIWKRKKIPTPLAAQDRPLIVGRSGHALAKSSIESAWQRLIELAVEKDVIRAEDRFGLHDLKRRGTTDTKGTRAEKQEGTGHRSASMMDVYDKSVPVVDPAGDTVLAAELSAGVPEADAEDA